MANLSRAQMALLITEYGLNVEHIVYGRDDYSFNNSRTYFTDEYYYLAEEHYNKLWDRMVAIYPEDSGIRGYCEEVIGEFNNLGDEWQGSCYGMALTTILDKMGKIDLNGNFAPGATTMNEVDMQERSLIESAINYYQISQKFPAYVNWLKPEDISQESVLENIVATCEDEKGLMLFGYYRGVYGHMVVAYDIEKTDANTYQIKAYDNRDQRGANIEGEPIYITIDTERNSCTVHSNDRGKIVDEKVDGIFQI